LSQYLKLFLVELRRAVARTWNRDPLLGRGATTSLRQGMVARGSSTRSSTATEYSGQRPPVLPRPTVARRGRRGHARHRRVEQRRSKRLAPYPALFPPTPSPPCPNTIAAEGRTPFGLYKPPCSPGIRMRQPIRAAAGLLISNKKMTTQAAVGITMLPTPSIVNGDAPTLVELTNRPIPLPLMEFRVSHASAHADHPQADGN